MTKYDPKALEGKYIRVDKNNIEEFLKWKDATNKEYFYEHEDQNYRSYLRGKRSLFFYYRDSFGKICYTHNEYEQKNRIPINTLDLFKKDIKTRLKELRI